MAFGLRLKNSIIRQRYVLDVVGELKRRFRKLLHMYQDKNGEQNFLELKSLIENFDIGALSRIEEEPLKT